MSSEKGLLGGNPVNTLPLILQAETAECGLACLAMVASYYGHSIDLRTLRQRYAVSLRGMTLRQLMELAKLLDLRARPLKAEMEDLRHLTVPCILHWDQ